MNLEERFEKLESELARERRRNRRLTITVMVCLLAFGLFEATATLLAARGGGHQVIRATSFVLVDKNGFPHAVLSTYDGEPGLILADKNGKIRATLRLFKGEPSLGLGGKNGKSSALLSVSKGKPRLKLFDKKGKLRWHAP
ncbi:MAG: hypothetical protein ABIH66_11355 [bacterium]